MYRLYLIAILCVFVHGTLNAQDEAKIIGALDGAKNQFVERMAAARLQVDNAISALIERTAKDNRISAEQRIKEVDNLTAEQKSFRESGTLPSSKQLRTVTTSFERVKKIEAARVHGAFADAANALSASGNLETAKAIIAERDSFITGQGKKIHPDDAVEFNGKHYKVFEEHLTWKEAKSRCEQLGGHLAVVNSLAENDFIYGLAAKTQLQEIWLGATDEKREGEWFWVNGQRMSFASWGLYQPNNKGAGEHFLLLVINLPSLPEFTQKWCDQPNIAESLHYPGYVCQWD